MSSVGKKRREIVSNTHLVGCTGNSHRSSEFRGLAISFRQLRHFVAFYNLLPSTTSTRVVLKSSLLDHIKSLIRFFRSLSLIASSNTLMASEFPQSTRHAIQHSILSSVVGRRPLEVQMPKAIPQANDATTLPTSISSWNYLLPLPPKQLAT